MRYAKCFLRTQNVDIFAQHCGRRKPNYTDKNAHAWWSFTICSRCNQMKFPTFQCYQTNSKRLILYLLTISSLLLCSYYVYQSFLLCKGSDLFCILCIAIVNCHIALSKAADIVSERIVRLAFSPL